MKAGAVAAGVLASSFAAVVSVVGALGVVFYGMVAPFINAFRLTYSLYEVGKKLLSLDWGAWATSLVAGAVDAGNGLLAFDWSGLGMSLVDGVISGVRSGVTSLVATMKDLGGQAWGAFKAKLGIASPSKVFARMGLAIPQGIEAGVRAGSPRAQRSVEDAVRPRAQRSVEDAVRPRAFPSVPASASVGESSSPRLARGRAGAVVSIGDVHIHGADGKGGRELAADFKRELERVLEDVATSLGAEVTPNGVS
jgi:hypothetical protein